MNLAIVSPSKNTYSETFIQAHKKIKADKVFFYYGGFLPTHLEGEGPINLCNEILSPSKLFRLIKNLHPRLVFNKTLSIKEKFFASSLKRHKIDIVLAEFGPTGVICKKVCEKLNIPLITHFHGFDITAGLKDYREKYIDLIETSPFVVGVSKEMVKTLIDLGATPEQAIYSPCGPNPRFYSTVPKFDNNNFISVGRFVDKKAPYYLIMAFKDVVRDYPDAILTMIGDGPLHSVCKNLITALSLENNIKLVGVKSPEEIQQFHSDSIAYLQHSVTAENGDKEGTPVGVMEASASALPVISTLHAGIKDVVIDKETGLLCKEHDFKQMAENIKWIIEHKVEAQEMGLKGRRFVQENVSLDKHIGTLSEAVALAYRLR